MKKPKASEAEKGPVKLLTITIILGVGAVGLGYIWYKKVEREQELESIWNQRNQQLADQEKAADEKLAQTMAALETASQLISAFF